MMVKCDQALAHRRPTNSGFWHPDRHSPRKRQTPQGPPWAKVVITKGLGNGCGQRGTVLRLPGWAGAKAPPLSPRTRLLPSAPLPHTSVCASAHACSFTRPPRKISLPSVPLARRASASCKPSVRRFTLAPVFPPCGPPSPHSGYTHTPG